MDHFEHRDGRLWCEAVPLDALAEAVGTPAFVYSASTIRNHVARLREAFTGLDPTICYAVKANANLAVLSTLRGAGCGFDIVSGGELERVLRIGADPSTVVFSGVGKTEVEMEAALRAGIAMFNLESEEEASLLATVAERVGTPARVSVRVNPDVDPKTHRYITTGRKENKFGVNLERGEALARAAAANPHLVLKGIQCHIGSQITDVGPYREAVGRTTALALRLREDIPELEFLNMGGGYGIYYKDAAAPALVEYADAVRPVLEGTGLKLKMEPGRVIVGNAGVMLTRVQFNKTSGEKRFVIVDAGMNDLLRPSLYEGYHRIWPVRGTPPPPLGEEGDAPPCDVVGPVCESGDFFAVDRPLPPVARGDVLAVMSVGAYAFTMSSNYNDRARALEVLVDGDSYAVVRARETYADMLRLERPDAAYETLPASSDGASLVTAEFQPCTIRGPSGASFEVGGDAPFLIAGPCVIENREMSLRHAEALRDLIEPRGFRFAYKSSFDKANRTSIDSFRGPGMDAGLEILAEVRREVGVSVLTDIHTPDQAAPVAEVVDVLQIPAFLCRQTDLLVAAAKTGTAVNVKKGQFLAPESMQSAVGKLREAGGSDICLTERGSMFGYGNLVVDMRAFPILRSFGHPVIFDGTHSVQRPGGLGKTTGGDRTEVPGLVRAATAVGVDGYFLEVHEDPDNGPCDGPNMLRLDTLGALLDQVNRIRDAIA